MSIVFGAVRQVAYVTRDLHQTLQFLTESAGIGPWFVSERSRMPGTFYRGRPSELEMSVGLANSGGVQIEVIHSTGTDPCVYSEWLDSNPDELAVQHLSSWPDDYATAYAAARGRGFVPVQEGANAQGGFAYLQHPARPRFMFEMAELTTPRRRLFDFVAQAAQGWDGQDPIRARPVF